jgi:hypothetical protein
LPIAINRIGSPIAVDGIGYPIAVDGIGSPIAVDGIGSPIAVDGIGYPIAVDGIGSPIDVHMIRFPIAIVNSWRWDAFITLPQTVKTTINRYRCAEYKGKKRISTNSTITNRINLRKVSNN